MADGKQRGDPVTVAWDSNSEEVAGVSLRPFPYPYRAMLAISNDIDQSSAPRFRSIHRFLNTTEETPMGPGLGLDVADSFWFYGRAGRGRQEDASDFTYFAGLDWKEQSSLADEIVHYLRSGWIDTIHSYGNFSGVPAKQACSRAHAEHALEALAAADVAPRVWVNHGSAENVQNIGNADYMQGDRPGSPCYHSDLLRSAGVEYFWEGSGSNQFGRASALSPRTLNDGSPSLTFSRFYTLDFASAIAHGLRPAVAEQMRRTRDYAVLWHPPHLHVQLSEPHLEGLVREQGFAVVAQHFGATPRGLNLGGPALASLRRLSEYSSAGSILVARTSRLLDFNRSRDFVRAVLTEDAGGVTIDIAGIDDPLTGVRQPTLDELRGLTFYAPDPRNVRLLVDGVPVPGELVQENAADQHLPSVGIRWFEPDHTDHSEAFTPRSRKAPSLDPTRTADTAQQILAAQADDPVAGVNEGAYRYALDYSRHRYARVEESIDRLRYLGFSGLKRGLDIGSGAGQWCIAFLADNRSVAGLDSRAEFVELARRVSEGLGLGDRTEYVVGRAEALPFEGRSFAAAWSHSVLQFVDAELALAEAGRVLESGGLFYCAYSTFGFRLRAIHKALAAQEYDAASRQVAALFGARRYLHGVEKTPWARSPTLDDVIAIADASGLRFVDEPRVQDDQRDFLGYPETVDFLAQKRNEPGFLLAELSERPADDELLAMLERLIAVGCPRIAAAVLAARTDLAGDARARRLRLQALTKAGETEGELVDTLDAEETDTLVRGMLREQRGDYDAAVGFYRAGEDDPRVPFLAGGCLLALGRKEEAVELLSVGADAADLEQELDCRIGLLQVAAAGAAPDALAEEFMRLLARLGERLGREDEAAERIASLRSRGAASPQARRA